MKEKIGMEKLIELLNEYDECRGEKRRDYGWTKNKVELDVKIIIFKKFGFIKWLVENEKIDGEKFQEPKIRGTIGLISNWHNSEGKSYKDYSKELAYESLLMLLAISDTPIEDLISYLKNV